MNSSPPLPKNNQTATGSKGRNTGPNNDAGKHVLGHTGLNPAAAAFVPGPKPAGAPARGGPSTSERRAGGAGNQRGGRGGGERSRGRKEGGISRAFRSNKSTTETNKSAEGAPPVAARKVPSRENSENVADQSLLGRSPSQRFTSANHLLNFQPRYGQGQGQAQGVRGRGGGPSRRQAPRPLPYDRKKFLQANFRFLVGDAGNLHSCEKDPDLAPDWEDVVEVEMMVESALRCPISLDSPPLCPQITPCGHVFSFPSIMAHLMNHGGDNLRRASPCPLCYTPVVARELRLVHACTVTKCEVGDQLTFVLLKRPKSSVIPVPGNVEHTSGPASSPLPSGGNVVPSAWKPGQATAEGDQSGGEGTLHYNPYAAFTPISVEEATKLWHTAAETLADYAVQVTSEGGMEAAMEAPFVYAALDALASRAASWAERRQRRLLESAPPAVAATMQEPEEVATMMAAAVRQVSSAAVTSAAQRREAAKVQAQKETEFPSLAATLPSRPMPAPPATPSPETLRPGAENQHRAGTQEAFSEEEWTTPGGLSDGGGEGVDDGGASDGASPRARAEATTPPGRDYAFGVSPGDTHVTPTPDTLYFYQSEDGQWVFLTPFNVRALVAHYGSYAALPPRISAHVLELEELVQSEVVRRRHKFLGHLPLTGTFRLAEVDLKELLPPESVAPFLEEVQARETRRQRRAEAGARREAAQEAAAAAAVAALAPPSLQQLQAMPLPSEAAGYAAGGRSDDEILEDVLLQSLQDVGGDGTASGPGAEPRACQPPSGISFANITKMGYAATGPPLSSTPPLGSTPAWGARTPTQATPGPTPASPPPPGSSGMVKLAWGRIPSPASATLAHDLAADPLPSRGTPVPPDPDVKPKKKGGKKTLLMSTAGWGKF